MSPAFWQRTWSHPHALVVGGSALAGAFALQGLHPHLALDLPGAPWNWLLTTLPAALALAAGLLLPAAPAVRFLGGGPLAIVSLVGLALGCWPIAVFPVGVDAPAWLAAIGLGDPLRSLPFALALLAVVVNLAAALGRRLVAAETHTPVERVRFAILHLGLLVAIVGGAAGHAGLVRARFQLMQGAPPGAAARCEDGRVITLPFALRLERFALERFPPMLVVAEADGGLYRGEALVGPGVEETLRGLHVRVLEWLPSAAVPLDHPVPFADPAANPAARVAVEDASGARLAEGWLHPPSVMGGALSLALPGGRSLHLEAPRPRRFLAVVRTGTTVAADDPVEVVVNRPLRRDGWAIYLLSYDERLGAASRSAVFEAVEDRALPAIYLGLGLVLIGVLWHLWQPRPGARP